MTDITGHDIRVGDWVAYATRSWGRHDLKIARVKEFHRSPRPRDRWFNLGITIENINSTGRRYTAEIQPDMMVVIPESRVPEKLKDLLGGCSSE
jgi:hypothetical protein